MKIEFATLCDFATIREGLLHVLGAPISVVGRSPYPAPLGVALAAALTGTQDEMTADLTVNVRLLRTAPPEGESGDIAVFRGIVRAETKEGPYGSVFYDKLGFMTLPLTVPLQEVPLPAPGLYEVVIEAAELEPRRLPLLAHRVPEEGEQISPATLFGGV